MTNSYPISKVELLSSRYELSEPYLTLTYLNEALHHRFLPTLLEALIPVRVLTYKNKPYAIEHLDELFWLKKHYPDLEINTITIGKAKNLKNIDAMICSTYFIKHITSINNKDLYALEQHWKESGDHEPYLEQKMHAEMLGCNRSL